MFPRDTADPTLQGTKIFPRGKKCARTRGAYVRNDCPFPAFDTDLCVEDNLHGNENLHWFYVEASNRASFGDRLSRYLTSIKFSSLSKTRRRSEFPPPSLPLACNHRLLSVTVQTSTNVNFSSCVHRSSKRRNDTRSLFPFLFLFFFSYHRFGERKGAISFQVFDGQNRKTGGRMEIWT